MLRSALVAAALMFTGCGGSVTVTAPAASPTIVPADPTLDATCTPEPNLPPVCYQGSYQVSLTIGAPCYDPAYQQPEAWQWTYNGSTTARCETISN